MVDECNSDETAKGDVMIICDDCKEAKAEYAYAWRVDRVKARQGNKMGGDNFFDDQRGPYDWSDANDRTVAHEFVDLCEGCAKNRGWWKADKSTPAETTVT